MAFSEIILLFSKTIIIFRPEVYASISSIDDPTSLKAATGDSDSGDRTPHAPRRRKAMAPMPPPMFSDNANEASQETTSLSGTEEEAVVSNQTKFAISQALVSGVLNKPKKTLLTRPTTAYADKNVALVPLARSFSSSADPVDLLEHDSNSGKTEKNGSGDHSRLSETSSLDSLERRRYEDTARMKPKVPPPPRPDSKETKPQTGGILRVSTNHGSNDPELQTAIAHENHHGSETSKLPEAKALERQNSETSQSVEGDTRKPHRPSKPQRPAQSKQEQKSAESAIAGVGWGSDCCCWCRSSCHWSISCYCSCCSSCHSSCHWSIGCCCWCHSNCHSSCH